jgi:predicted RNA-binding protein with PIN domain
MTDDQTPLLVVDAANVIGSRPDGWWRDRAGAARRLLTKLAAYQQSHPATPITVILEGAAKSAATPRPNTTSSAASSNRPSTADSHAPRSGDQQPSWDNLEIVLAPHSGDDTIVDVVRATAAHDATRPITVITADRALRARVEALGATTAGPNWLWSQLA